MLFDSIQLQAAAAAALLVVVCLAVREDMLRQRVPNTLTAAALITGIGLACLSGSVERVVDSALGVVVGFAVLVPFYLLRGMGAGDVKLMAAAGSFLGPSGALMAAAVTLLAGLVFAVVLAAWRLGESRAVVAESSAAAAANNGQTSSVNTVLKERFPYALAVGVGVVGMLWWQGALGALLVALGAG